MESQPILRNNSLRPAFLDNFIIFFTFGLERLPVFLRVSESYSTWDTWIEPKLSSAMTFSLPMQTGAAVLLMTLLQFVAHQACREIRILVPSHMAVASCKGTEKELRQERSRSSDPLCHVLSQHVPTMALRKNKTFLGSSKSSPPKRRSPDCSQSQDGQKCHRVWQELLRHILYCMGLGNSGCLQEEGLSMSQECAWEKKVWLFPTLGQTLET